MSDSEKYFKELCNLYSWGSHKYGDVRKCIHCGGLLPKSEQMPDYVVMPLPYVVECKNDNASHGSWPWAEDFGPTGKRFIQKEKLARYNGWLFVVLGDKPAPRGKSAWLIPWDYWLKIEERLLSMGQMSIPFEGTPRLESGRTLFNGFILEWLDGGFIIPRFHPFWKKHAERLTEELERARGMLTHDQG